MPNHRLRSFHADALIPRRGRTIEPPALFQRFGHPLAKGAVVLAGEQAVDRTVFGGLGNGVIGRPYAPVRQGSDGTPASSCGISSSRSAPPPGYGPAAAGHRDHPASPIAYRRSRATPPHCDRTARCRSAGKSCASTRRRNCDVVTSPCSIVNARFGKGRPADHRRARALAAICAVAQRHVLRLTRQPNSAPRRNGIRR